MTLTKFFIGLLFYVAIGEGVLLYLCSMPLWVGEIFVGPVIVGFAALMYSYKTRG